MAAVETVEVDAPVPDPGHAPTRADAERAIAFGAFPAPAESLVHILAALLRIEDQIGGALAPAPTQPAKRGKE